MSSRIARLRVQCGSVQSLIEGKTAKKKNSKKRKKKRLWIDGMV